MALIVKVIETVDRERGDQLLLGFPDENGTKIRVSADCLDGLQCLRAGERYTLAFVPMLDDAPVDHPLVIHPESAEMADVYDGLDEDDEDDDYDDDDDDYDLDEEEEDDDDY